MQYRCVNENSPIVRLFLLRFYQLRALKDTVRFYVLKVDDEWRLPV